MRFLYNMGNSRGRIQDIFKDGVVVRARETDRQTDRYTYLQIPIGGGGGLQSLNSPSGYASAFNTMNIGIETLHIHYNFTYKMLPFH
jgi:hypothetical protein